MLLRQIHSAILGRYKIKFIPRKGAFKSHFSQVDGQDDEKLGLQLSAQSRAKSESASEPVKFLQNADIAGRTYNNVDEWTLVNKGRKSLKADKASQRPYPAGFYATPHPSDIKMKIRKGTQSFEVYAPPNTSTVEIKSRAFEESPPGEVKF